MPGRAQLKMLSTSHRWLTPARPLFFRVRCQSSMADAAIVLAARQHFPETRRHPDIAMMIPQDYGKTKTYRIPDSLVAWPYQRRLNPHYETVKAASSSWLRGFRAFGEKAQRAYDACDFSELAWLDRARMELTCQAFLLRSRILMPVWVRIQTIS